MLSQRKCCRSGGRRARQYLLLVISLCAGLVSGKCSPCSWLPCCSPCGGKEDENDASLDPSRLVQHAQDLRVRYGERANALRQDYYTRLDKQPALQQSTTNPHRKMQVGIQLLLEHGRHQRNGMAAHKTDHDQLFSSNICQFLLQ